MYYLIKYNDNYADEFDVYFHQVLTKDQLEEAKIIISNTNWEYEEFYFGTNEWIDVNTQTLLKALDNAIELTEEQYKVLEDLELTSIGFGDGLNWGLIIDAARDQLNQEDE